MHDDEVGTDVALVARLVAGQFPAWDELPIGRVDSYGTDNAIYRLGEQLSVRLPRIHWAVAPLRREFAWLPRIAAALPVEVPVPVALGAPAEGYEWPWTVCRWLEGTHPAIAEGSADDVALARDLSGFVRAMRALDPAGAPSTAWPRPMHDEDGLVRTNLARLPGLGQAGSAVAGVWEAAMTAPRYDGPLVWIHGDLTPANLLVRDDRLTGVLDFGAMGVGDPASDLRVAWNLLSPGAREVFRDAVGADDTTWARARGWALLQSLAQLSYFGDRNPRLTAGAQHVIGALAAEYDERAAGATRPRAPRTTRR